MKNIIKSVAFLLTLLVAFSCEESALDPLTGMYPVPESYSLNNLFGQSMNKQDNNTRVFTLKMASEGVTATYNESTFSYDFSGTGNYLSVDLVGSVYYLDEGTYTIADVASAGAGNYIAGYDAEFGGLTFENWGTCFFTVSNGTATAQKVVSGNIRVKKDDDAYEVYGTVTLEDGTVVRLSFAGEIVYEPDAYVPTYTYSVETETPAMGGSDGSVEISGTTKHKITVFADDEFSAYLEIVTDENATSLSGTYSVKDGLDAAGQLSNGYYLDFAWWGGAGTMDGGSYYMQNGEKMYLREGDGAVTIEDNSGTLSISGDNLAILDLDALIASSGATWTVLDTPGSLAIQDATALQTETPSYTYTNTITAPATYGWSATVIEGSQLNVITVTDGDNNTVAAFELITAEGATDLSGDYNVLDGSASAMAIGDANNGYYLDMTWYGQEGIQMAGCYYSENGENKYIRSGSVIHVVDNGGVLTISGDNLALLDVETLISSSGATWANLATAGSFSYSEISAAGSAGGEGTALTNVISASALDLSWFGGSGFIVTLKLSTDEVVATYDEATYSYSYTGNGNYISLDFNRDDATLPAGTYNVVANESATVGDCIAGYDNPYGAGFMGSVWGSLTDDVVTDLAVTGGTVDVAVDGDTYTITADVTTSEGSVKASYSGVISIQ